MNDNPNLQSQNQILDLDCQLSFIISIQIQKKNQNYYFCQSKYCRNTNISTWIGTLGTSNDHVADAWSTAHVVKLFAGLGSNRDCIETLRIQCQWLLIIGLDLNGAGCEQG